MAAPNAIPNTLHKDRFQDGSCAPWDAFERPGKSVADYTEDEALAEAANLARMYLLRQGYDLVGEPWVNPATGHPYLELRNPKDGTPVIVAVRGRVDLERATHGAPDPTDKEKETLQEAVSAYEMDHDGAEGIRADVIDVTIVGERLARLRHFIGVTDPEA